MSLASKPVSKRVCKHIHRLTLHRYLGLDVRFGADAHEALMEDKHTQGVRTEHKHVDAQVKLRREEWRRGQRSATA